MTPSARIDVLVGHGSTMVTVLSTKLYEMSQSGKTLRVEQVIIIIIIIIITGVGGQVE